MIRKLIGGVTTKLVVRGLMGAVLATGAWWLASQIQDAARYGVMIEDAHAGIETMQQEQQVLKARLEVLGAAYEERIERDRELETLFSALRTGESNETDECADKPVPAGTVDRLRRAAEAARGGEVGTAAGD